MTDENFTILPSKINKDDNNLYEIVESSATFPKELFLRQVRDEMQYYDIDLEQLSKSTFIGSFRLGLLLNGNGIIEQHEINKIRNRLHF